MRSPNNLEFNWEMHPPSKYYYKPAAFLSLPAHTETWRRSGFAHWRRKWLRNLPFVITVRSWERSRSERSTLRSPQHCPEGQLSSGGEVSPRWCTGDPTRVQRLWGVTEQAVRQRVTLYSSSIPPKSYILFPFSSRPTQLQQNKDLQVEEGQKTKVPENDALLPNSQPLPCPHPPRHSATSPDSLLLCLAPYLTQ